MKTQGIRVTLIPSLWIALLLLHATISHAQCWKLVWADEFDGSLLDSSRWNTRIGNDWDLLHYNTDRTENIRVEDGVLRLIARRESYMGFDYTAALLHTERIAAWRYGRIEARMKLPGTQGFVPAFWLLPAQNRYGWWPDSGEIDIMEHPTHQPHTVYGTVHTAAYNLFGGSDGPQGSTVNLSDFERAYHVYAVEWNDEQIDLYVDDIKYFTFANQDAGYTTWPFDQPFFIRLGLGVGGGWVGPPDNTTVFPASMEIDYVRVFQDLNDVTITGADYVLPDQQEVSYEVPDINGAGYSWDVTGSAAIVSGQSTHRIAVDWEQVGGIVSVDVATDCGDRRVVYPVEVTTNMLGNSGFEDGVNYWRKNLGYPASADFMLITNDAHSGSNSLCLDVKTAGHNPWDVQVSQGDLQLESGEQYQVSFWARTEGGSHTINSAVIDSATYAVYGGKSFTLTDAWTQYDFNFRAAAGASASFNLDAGIQAGTYWFDDLVLAETGFPNANQVSNGDFSTGQIDWNLTALWPAEATGAVRNSEYRVSIVRGGNFSWDVSLMQKGLRIEKGKTYHMLFDAYSSEPRLISALVGKDGAPWTIYSGNQEFTLSTSRETYTYSFTMNDSTDPAARLAFDLGTAAGQVFFDNIVLVREEL